MEWLSFIFISIIVIASVLILINIVVKKAKFKKIVVGMTYEEVIAIVGKPDDEVENDD